jgi:hypothetical protein
MDSRSITTQRRLEESGQEQAIRRVCSRVEEGSRNRGRGRPRRAPPSTPGQRRKAWVDSLLARHRVRGREPTPKELAMKLWIERAGREREASCLANGFATGAVPDPRNLRVYEGLQKAESSVVFQLRTGVIGLNHFLKKMRVPGVDSELCECGSGPETGKHVVIHCSLYEDRRRSLENPVDWQVHYGDLVGSLLGASGGPGARRLARWMIQLGRISQFSLASRLLY